MASTSSKFAAFLGLGKHSAAAAESEEARKTSAAKKSAESEDEKDTDKIEDKKDEEECESENDDKKNKKGKKAKGKAEDKNYDDDADEDEKSKKAEDDGDEEMRGTGVAAAARIRERERISTIVLSPDAARAPELALSLALDTRLSRAEALAVLASAPKAAPPLPATGKTAYEKFMERNNSVNVSTITPEVGAKTGDDLDLNSPEGFVAYAKQVAAKRHAKK